MTDKVLKTHQTCPDCGANGCLTVWDNGGTFCHSCGKSGGGKSRKDYEETSFTKEQVPYRNLTQKAVDKYEIVTWLDSKGGHYKREYKYPSSTKNRVLPKDFSSNYGFKPEELFGMDKFNAGSHSTITIVEGEDDAPAAWQILGGSNPVVSVPSATVSSKLLAKCHKWLDSFKEIIVATDGDAAGDRAASSFASAFPNKVYRVNMTKFKDPQEYLENGEGSAFKFAWLNRQKYVPEFDTSTPDAFLKLIVEGEDEEFISSGIEAYDKTHGGLFQGHVTLFKAPEGSGKTELFHFFEHHFLKNYPEIPFASCHLEETQKRTTLAWVSYDLMKNVTRKDLITDMTEVEESVKRLTASENAHLFTIGIDEEPEVILDRVKYYANVCGCKFIFIEPIQDLAQQYSGTESTERFLSKIAVQLARIATELNIGIVIIAHENDEGKISDCRKLGKQASVVVTLERDIENPDDDIRNTTVLRSSKNRPTSFVGYAGTMKFDPSTFTLSEDFS